MPTTSEIVQERQKMIAELARFTAVSAVTAWRRVNPAAIIQSWLGLLVDPLAMLVAAQTLAAQDVDDYVTSALSEQGSMVVPEGRLVPATFSGTNSDGRPLVELLYQPMYKTMTLIGSDVPPSRALGMGAANLDMIVRTQVSDAARVATGVAVTARANVGWMRVLNPPSCSRCVVLAGRMYRWSDGFERHPRDDCNMVPGFMDLADDLTTDPLIYFRSLSREDQDRTFTAAGAQAIRDGANIGRVVNARKGMAVAGIAKKVITTAGSGRRSRAIRLMPEQIYRDAAGDRQEALRLLKRHGFIL